MPSINIPISKEMAQALFSISLTLLLAIIINNILRSFIKVPKSFDSRRARTYATIVRNSITIIVYAVTIHIIFIELGINLTPLLASAGIIGIILGIGARALIEDLINGFFLLTQDSIAIGDYVKLDDAEGNIEKIGFRTLVIRGDSGELYIIPNGQVKNVINFSRHKSHMNVDFPVKTDQNIDASIKAMGDALEELQKDKEMSEHLFPGSSVKGIEEFKVDGKMILRAKIITRPEVRFEAARKYRYLVKKNFEKNKIIFG
jgi:small conductance mechanosensitive channel